MKYYVWEYLSYEGWWPKEFNTEARAREYMEKTHAEVLIVGNLLAGEGNMDNWEDETF